MFHRFAMAGTYKDSPTAVRCSWLFRDFVEAHVMLDAIEAVRPKVEADIAAQAKSDARGARG